MGILADLLTLCANIVAASLSLEPPNEPSAVVIQPVIRLPARIIAR
jgi:hypothetical protein